MRETLASYLEDFLSRGGETAFAHRRGLRIARWSYRRVAGAAFQFARELEERGVQKGDRVLLWAANGPEWIAAFLGCLARGAIVVPLDVQSDPGFVSRVEAQVEPKLALLDSSGRGAVKRSLPVILREELEERLSRHPSEPYSVAGIGRDDTLEIVFTSGTTAEPRGVRITHRNLLVNLVPLEEEIGRYLKYERLVHPIRFLNLLPLSHVFGQIMGVFVPQLLGGEVFFQSSLAPGQVIEAIKRERISVLVAVPRVLDALREKIERDYEARGELDRFRRAFASARRHHPLRRWWEFRSIHAMFGLKFWAFISGGATLSPSAEEFWDRLGFAVIQGYGMTETASLVSVNHPFKLARGSVGRVMPGQEVKLAPDGEILVRGENVSPGYWKGSGAAETQDGWLHTGDVGEIDKEGNLFFKGRKKEVIVTAAGMKIYPEDIEEALDREPEVRGSAIVAADGPNGPEPLAVLILRRPDADVNGVIDRANASLAQHQHVRRWFIWPDEDFPRTPTQKVLRRLVAERALGASSGAARSGTPPPAGATSAAIDDIVSRIGKAAPGAPGAAEPAAADSSATLGAGLKLDSLGRVELLSALEDRYQIEIDEAVLTEATTVGELQKIIREGSREEAAPYPYPRWQQRWPLRWLHVALLYALVLPATRILGKPKVMGKERLRNLRGPALFVCNHVTAVDHALILLALPGRFRRRMSIAMDGERLRGLRRPPRGTGLAMRLYLLLQYILAVFFFDVFSMPRMSGFRRSFAFAGEMMDRGRSILVFPEGRFTEDGSMGPFMPGTGLLISELGAPVVPMRIDGLWKLKEARRRRAKRGEITVSIGEPASYSLHGEAGQIALDLERRVKAL